MLVDLVIVEFLFGLMFWYATKYAEWSALLMGTQLAFLLGMAIALAVWMWQTVSVKGGLGEDEHAAAAKGKRVADK